MNAKMFPESIFRWDYGLSSSNARTMCKLSRSICIWKNILLYYTDLILRKVCLYRICFLLAGVPFLNSCATIFNTSTKDVEVHTTAPTTLICERDTVITDNNEAEVSVLRQKEPVLIVATSDSSVKHIALKPSLSPLYWGNIAANAGLGILIDRKKNDRFSYPNKIYINSSDSSGTYYSYGFPNRKGDLHLHFSLPHVNSFRFVPENERPKLNAGFWGVNLGIDYYYTSTRYVSIGASTITDFLVPVPAAVDFEGEHEFMGSSFIHFSNNQKLKWFSFGYGLSIARNAWDLRQYKNFDSTPPSRPPVKKVHYALGLYFPMYLLVGNNLYLGTAYRPTFFRWRTQTNFVYEHTISFEIGWKWRLGTL